MAAKSKSTRKSSKRRYGPSASRNVQSAMRRRKKGTLSRGKRGAGGRVRSRKQAIAIGLNEARQKGAKVPGRRRSTGTRRRRSTTSTSGSRSRRRTAGASR